MDKILVTLLLIVIGLTTMIGLSSWMSEVTDSLKIDANASLEILISE